MKKNVIEETVVGIREASHMLGVTETTLRQWTDEGKLKAFITPGGHRRFLKSDLSRFMRARQNTLGLKDLAERIGDTTESHKQMGREFVDGRPDGIVADDASQKLLGSLGREFLDLIVKYVTEPARREENLAVAREVGCGFGRTLAEMGLPLAAAVAGFVRHREPVVAATTRLLGGQEAVGGRVIEAMPLINHIMDETLISMISTHQQCIQASLKGDQK
jgi:excisionase family DNA binding protein